MENKKIKWLIYTVLVGLIPILSRLLVYAVTQAGTIDLFNASDFVAFGLVLHISNINEIEHLTSMGRSWKTIQNGTSIAFISFYSVLFALTLLGNIPGSVIRIYVITYCAMALNVVSFLLSFSVYYKVSMNPESLKASASPERESL